MKMTMIGCKMKSLIIYDGNCNLCTTFVRLLESIDRGERFCYLPMQKTETLAQLGIPSSEMEKGVILLEKQDKYQGMAAIERIGQLLPNFDRFVGLYNSIPGVKPLSNSGYEWVKDHRYQLFGQCQTYDSIYPFCDQSCPTPP